MSTQTTKITTRAGARAHNPTLSNSLWTEDATPQPDHSIEASSQEHSLEGALKTTLNEVQAEINVVVEPATQELTPLEVIALAAARDPAFAGRTPDGLEALRKPALAHSQGQVGNYYHGRERTPLPPFGDEGPKNRRRRGGRRRGGGGSNRGGPPSDLEFDPNPLSSDEGLTVTSVSCRSTRRPRNVTTQLQPLTQQQRDDLLLTCIQALTARGGGGGGGEKAAAPDKFSGADRTKLRGFLLSLKMVFAGNKYRYSSDRARVIYASGYLSANPKKTGHSRGGRVETSSAPPRPQARDNSTRPPLNARGKLPQAEKDRQAQLGLCGFCGSNQHKLDTCPTKPQSNLRAVDPVPEEPDVENMLNADFFDSKN